MWVLKEHTGVAVGGTASRVSPAPVGINDNLTVLVRAATAGAALLPAHGRVRFRSKGTDLLGACDSQQGRERGQLGVHLVESEENVWCVVTTLWFWRSMNRR